MGKEENVRENTSHIFAAFFFWHPVCLFKFLVYLQLKGVLFGTNASLLHVAHKSWTLKRRHPYGTSP
jgi:hypothetical protein